MVPGEEILVVAELAVRVSGIRLRVEDADTAPA